MTLNRKNKRTDIDIMAKTVNTIDKSRGVSDMSTLEIRIAYHAEQRMFSVCRSCSNVGAGSGRKVQYHGGALFKYAHPEIWQDFDNSQDTRSLE